MPIQEEREEVLWPYGTWAAFLSTAVWMMILTIIIHLTARHFGWPGPEMLVIVYAGLAFYGFIPLLLVMLDKIWIILYGAVEHREVEAVSVP